MPHRQISIGQSPHPALSIYGTPIPHFEYCSAIPIIRTSAINPGHFWHSLSLKKTRVCQYVSESSRLKLRILKIFNSSQKNKNKKNTCYSNYSGYTYFLCCRVLLNEYLSRLRLAAVLALPSTEASGIRLCL